jgi:hypothetical protein
MLCGEDADWITEGIEANFGLSNERLTIRHDAGNRTVGDGKEFADEEANPGGA